MYITAFALISSLSLEMEAILFAVNRNPIDCKILEENLKPGRYPVSYRQPRFFKRRV